MTIIDKLNRRIDTVNSLLCVSLDSDIRALPEPYRHQDLPQFEFNRAIINATHEYVSTYKFNSAYYEARGESGWRELQMSLDYLRDVYPDIVTICDAKRADTYAVNRAYASAIYDTLGFDAVTLHPYMGSEALAPFLERGDKAAIIVCRTSNPGAGELQNLLINDVPLYLRVAEMVVERWNARGNCMLLCGADVTALHQLRALVGTMPLLMASDTPLPDALESVLDAGLTPDQRGLIINAGRGVIFDAQPRTAALHLRDAINMQR